MSTFHSLACSGVMWDDFSSRPSEAQPAQIHFLIVSHHRIKGKFISLFAITGWASSQLCTKNAAPTLLNFLKSSTIFKTTFCRLKHNIVTRCYVCKALRVSVFLHFPRSLCTFVISFHFIFLTLLSSVYITAFRWQPCYNVKGKRTLIYILIQNTWIYRCNL